MSLEKNMPQAAIIAKLAEVFNVEPKILFEFSHLVPIDEVKQDLLKRIESMNDEQVVLTYKYVKNFVI